MPFAPGATTSTAPSSLSTPTTPPRPRHFPTQPKLTRRQACWMELLQEYDFDLKYNRGVGYIVPDALSQRPDYRDPDPVSSTTSASPCLPTSATSLFRTTTMTLALDPSTRIAWKGRSPTDTTEQSSLLHSAWIHHPWPSALPSCTTPTTLPQLDNLVFRRLSTTIVVFRVLAAHL